MNAADNKTLRHLKGDLVVSVLESCGTRIILSACSSVKELNETKFLSCKGFLPIGNLVYELQSDNYIINCFDYIDLGTVPISLVATTKGCPSWSAKMPLPEKVIKKHLNSKQKKEIKNFLSKFDKEFSFSYVQMLDPNV